MTRSRYHGIREERGDHPRGRAQVARRLEQRDDAARRRDASLALQQLDGENIGWLPGHRDDVGAERFGMDRRHHPERVEHFGDARVGRHPGRRQLAALREHVDEKIHAPLFRPAAVLAEAERAGDGVDGLGMAFGLLPYVQAHEGQAEGGHPSQDVRQAAVGDDAVAGGVQGAVAEQERLSELGDRLEHFRLPGEARPAGVGARCRGTTGGGRRAQQVLDVATRCVDALLQRTQQRAVRLVCALDVCDELGCGVRHRELEAQLLDLLCVERQRRSSAPSGRRCG